MHAHVKKLGLTLRKSLLRSKIGCTLHNMEQMMFGVKSRLNLYNMLTITRHCLLVRGAYHFFSGMGLGTVFTLQGLSGCPNMFLPRMTPTRFRGRITNRQMQATATYENKTNT